MIKQHKCKQSQLVKGERYTQTYVLCVIPAIALMISSQISCHCTLQFRLLAQVPNNSPGMAETSRCYTGNKDSSFLIYNNDVNVSVR